jgi:hypothetical protein
MDITVFVGFASSGPLHVPVAVEDLAEFTAVFGEDAPLAWDQQKGERRYANLGPAVRSFFQNGGRRCWIIRVAGHQARANYFPIPGMLMVGLKESSDYVETLAPAFAQARSEGSWSDHLTVAATILSKPVQISFVSPDGRHAHLASNPRMDIKIGDLLRVTFGEGHAFLMMRVDSVNSGLISSPAEDRFIEVGTTCPLWFRSLETVSPLAATTPAKMRIYSYEREAAFPDGSLENQTLKPDPWGGFESEPIGVDVVWPSDKEPRLDVEVPAWLFDHVAPGSVVRVDIGTEQLWITVGELKLEKKEGSSSEEVLRLKGHGLGFVSTAPPLVGSPLDVMSAELVTFELAVREGADRSWRLSDLGFAPNHPRYWGALPTDDARFQNKFPRVEDREKQAFWGSPDRARETDPNSLFPLATVRRRKERRVAGSTDADEERSNVVYVPLFMPALPEYLKQVRLNGDPLMRDGLSTFDDILFLDPDMRDVSTTTLMSQAELLQYLASSPRRLRGIHAALAVEEASLIAVPDAVHRSWSPVIKEPSVLSPISSPPVRPEWWHFLPCDPPPTFPIVEYPPRGHFLTCDSGLPSPPTLSHSGDGAKTIGLTWSTVEETEYELEEATSHDFSGAVRVYEGKDTGRTLYGRSERVYYYRVRAKSSKGISNWSNGVAVPLSTRGQSQITDQPTSDILLAVHRALMRMCAARGDLFAILTVPDHYREDDVIKHVRDLKRALPLDQATFNKPSSPDKRPILPFRTDEMTALSYAAMYHPWLIGREDEGTGKLKDIPPDGAVCGTLAARALKRGAWIAPANELIYGVVALTPPIDVERRLDLQDAQINVIRHEPRGFVTLAAETLSEEEDTRPINVRRLLILLRRLALRVGPRYVFEPNNDAFRRLVHRGFERVLEELFERGAFAGPTPPTSFQVVTSASLNTRQSIEQGRFIVELKVAPSLPMRFLTVRLVQIGDKTLVVEGR